MHRRTPSLALARTLARTLAPALALALTLVSASAYAAPPPGLDLPIPGDPHPPALNTATCAYHGTTSPADATYATFAASLVGPRGNTRNLQDQIELHQVGGASVVIIEAGAITQHHWYGCRDRKRASRTTANTLYQAASLSKFVSAVGLVYADRAGDLDLDDDMAFLADEFPDSLLAEWVGDNFRRDSDDYPEAISVRRLLSHSAGLDTHSIGAWSPLDVPTMREIIMGTNDFGSYYPGGVEPIYAPGTNYEYSGGGYTVAEHVLELHTAPAFKDYLDDHVLGPARMFASTFEKASSATPNLARGCSRSACNYDLQQTNVKAAGGLLANAREYAELVTALYNGGTTDGGGRVMVQSDLDAILAPSSHANASLAACTTTGTTRTTYISVGGRRYPFAFETCIAGKWRMPLSDDDGDWYGLGVGLSATLHTDGYPRTVSHSGAQTGSRTYFEIDRRTGDGVVIMVNGEAEWTDGDGYLFGSSPLLWEILRAYHAAY